VLIGLALPVTTSNTSTWLAALDSSSVRLFDTVRGLTDDLLAVPSFASDWTIAQVLSHLGSAAEICSNLLERGQAGDLTPPTAEEVRPVWQRWDALSGPAQREAWHEADRRHRELLFSVDRNVTIPYFAGPLELAQYAGYRLSEQAVHAWDIEVALRPSAVLHDTDLLWERLDLVVSRFHDAEIRDSLKPRVIDVPGGTLEIGDELHLSTNPANSPDGTVSGDQEALIRLVYGRNRASDDLQADGAVTLDDLRRLFPGY
jgi:uncharacterized protein (TIGR03083 family)